MPHPAVDCVHRIDGRVKMPILLWFLGVPISIVLLLMLFGVISF